jgi:hypothetical protein
MRMAAGARTGLVWPLFLVPWPLFVIMVWFMFHNPTIHGVLLNGADDDGTYVGDWTCLAPHDITLFRASNEYGGQEVADSAYAKAHCDAAGHKSFAMGAAAGVAGGACLVYGVVLDERRRREAVYGTTQR